MNQRDTALLSRRLLLAGLGVGTVGAVGALTGGAPRLGLGLGSAAGVPAAEGASWWDRSVASLHGAGLTEWSSFVGETFILSGAHSLRLVAVTVFPQSGRRPPELGRSKAFSIVFESVGGPPLPATDKVYELVHPSFRSLPVYMSAPFAVGRATRLIAVFN